MSTALPPQDHASSQLGHSRSPVDSHQERATGKEVGGGGALSGAEWPVLNYGMHLSSARPCVSGWYQHLPEHLESRNLVLFTSLHDVLMGTLKTAVGYGHKASHSLKDQEVGPPVSSVQFSHPVMSGSLRLHGLQHTRPPSPLLTPRV